VARIAAIAPELFFASKIDATLKAAGHELTGSVADDVDLVIVDLDNAPFDAAPPGVPPLGFYSHVDVETRRRAEAAGFDLVVLLTGVGTRTLIAAVEKARGTREAFIESLRRSRIAARGPKPVAVLREFDIPVWFTAPEPNTWRELVAGLDARRAECPLAGARVAVQEYGAANPELLAALEERGAEVVRVPVYQWALPEDLEPLKAAVRKVAAGEVDVALFTTGTQAAHLFHVAAAMGMQSAVEEGFRRVKVASIGPTTSEELRQQGIQIDLEASHPKMGFLVREAAERSAELMGAKRT